MSNTRELIFVYNADSGLWNSYMDSMHKIFSPKTYSCNLCAITHGTFGMKKDWSDFIKTLPLNLKFVHRDEWLAANGIKEELPAIFLNENGNISSWLNATTLNEMNLNELKQFILEKSTSLG